MKHLATAAAIVDVLVGEPHITYSRLLVLLPGKHKWKAGVVLHQLIAESIVYRSSDGRYSLSKDSTKALVAA